jgi:hypothetical protein
MNARWFLFGFVAALIFSAPADAVLIVTTNMNGADAEVREDGGDISPNTDPLWGPLGAPKGVNRGSSTELASRVKDSTAGSGDNGSAMYLKFDISDANGVTNALLSTNRTALRLTTRNSAQLKWNRIQGLNPYYGTLPADDTNPDYVAFKSNPANYTRVQFNIFGLTNFAHPNYDWSESGVAATWDPVTSPTYGPKGSITWYNAPGITPDSRLTPAQDPGKYNFNSDLQLLGKATIEDPGLPLAVPPPYPTLPGAGSAALCVGCTAIDFEDPNGLLHNLIVDAKAAGKTNITLVVAFGMDGFRNAAHVMDVPDETAQVTPNDFLAFNYLMNPKEMDGSTGATGQPGLQLNDDPSWDPDWSDNGPSPYDPLNDPTPIGPGPNTQMLPHPTTGVLTRYGAQNDDGRFSPQLVFFVPEPSSMLLIALGSLAASAIRRRRMETRG